MNIFFQQSKNIKNFFLLRKKLLKFRYSEKATKFEKILHLKFDATEYRQIENGRFFQILFPSQNVQTLTDLYSDQPGRNRMSQS